MAEETTQENRPEERQEEQTQDPQALAALAENPVQVDVRNSLLAG